MSTEIPQNRLFPILYGYKLGDDIRALRQAGVMEIVIGLPWAMLEPHERQAQRNHSQSLERLAARGGLGVCEALAVLEDRPWRDLNQAWAQQQLSRRIKVFEFTRREREAIEGRAAMQAAPAPTPDQ